MNNYKSSQGFPWSSLDWLSHLCLERATFPSLWNNTLGFPLNFYELQSLQLTPMCESQGAFPQAPFSGTPVCLLGKPVGQFGLVWTHNGSVDVEQRRKLFTALEGNHMQEVIYNVKRRGWTASNKCCWVSVDLHWPINKLPRSPFSFSNWRCRANLRSSTRLSALKLTKDLKIHRINWQQLLSSIKPKKLLLKWSLLALVEARFY